MSAWPSDATAATLRECRATCGPRVEDECGHLSRRRQRQCGKRIVRVCRRTGIGRCLLPTTTVTTATTTSEPTSSSDATTTSTTTGTTLSPLGFCGNGIIDPGERCDGPNLGEGACTGGGIVTCLPSCRGWNYNECAHCQNGVREGLEACDGDDLGGATCPEGSTGSPKCATNCRVDYEPCIQCGDGNLDVGEWCDDGNTEAGDGCSPTCQSECGDGEVEPPEESCDDGNRTSGDGCTAFCEVQHPYVGGGDDPADRCALEWGGSTSFPILGSITCTDGESPCDRGPAGDDTCRFLVFACVNNPSTFACDWSGVSRVELVGDSLTGARALTDAEQTSVLGAFVTMLEWAGGTVSGENPVREVTPVITAGSLCGQFAFDVASGHAKDIAVRIEDGRNPAAVDVDELTLYCSAGG